MVKYENILDLLKIHAGRMTTETGSRAITALRDLIENENGSFLEFIRLLDITISIHTEAPLVHELLSLRHDILLNQDYDAELFAHESLSPVLKDHYEALKNKETNAHGTAMLIRNVIIDANNKCIFSSTDPMPAIRRMLKFQLLTCSLDQATYIQAVLNDLVTE